MKKVYILALMLLMGQSSWAQIREFQTTRLNSTAGAGVATVLTSEAAILNPAASAFFNGSSFSYQSYSTSLRHESELRDSNNDDFASRNKSQGFFMSDHDGPIKGGIAYLMQNENDFERKQLITHGAAALGTQTAMGFAYRYITDVKPKGYSRRHEVSHQMSIGMTQVLDNNSLMGLTIVDPTRTTPNEERALIGFQYTITERFTLNADAGTQYTKDVRDKYLWRAAVQLQLFDDFFFRVGKFHDNIRQFKGTGWGISWIGPKLGLEFSQKFSDQYGKDMYLYRDEQLVDTSLAAVINF